MNDKLTCDVAVAGAGPAGLAAAAAAKKQGAGRVVVIERDASPGGILLQCIHPGFGLSYFKEELTGPEYALRFAKAAKEAGVEFLTDVTVLEIGDGFLRCIGAACGVIEIKAGAVVLAMGCRERPRGSIRTPGTRPAGVYTAGAGQRLVNRQNLMIGKKIVILGSGDIGMIMARRLTLQGAKVEAVVEVMPYLAGLTRNRVQCLDDFNIPLLLSHTVSEIRGHQRVEAVKIVAVDDKRQPVPGTERIIECDTLLLSVGLIPENELTRAAGIAIDPVTNGPSVNQYMQTSLPSVFACGNVVHVNDLVDNVSRESEQAGRSAARFAKGELPKAPEIACKPASGIRYVVPQRIALSGEDADLTLYFRVLAPGAASTLSAEQSGKVLASRKVRRVSPGEMEHLNVKSSALANAGLSVGIAAEEEK
ncbi:MAG: FAD-dependent oxidoreductase [Lentisphaeria bacterium]|nr:FAD-dependent oxidoreductase [Lentisphaeria bacterium]